MKLLLIKEFKLTCSKITYLFLIFAVMAIIPGYPILVGAFFICLGIFYTFQFAREYNDVVYTALLPVAKSDVVRARIFFVVTIQMIGFALAAVLTLIRMCFLSDSKTYVQNPLMNANLVFLGCFLIVYALFNMIFIPGFFKTAFYFGKPFIMFCVATFVFIGIMEMLHHINGFEMLNTCGFDYMGIQFGVLGIGVMVYVLGTIYALKKSVARFDRIDLSF